MSRFDEDTAYSQVNESSLEKEFNIDTSEERSVELENIRRMRQELVVAAESENPDLILRANIERANTLLDNAQQAIENGGQANARMYEVCAQLINAVTSAAASIQTGTFGDQKHEYNMKMLEVKEKEIMVKQAIAMERFGGKKSGESNGRVVVTDRETLLRMIDKENLEIEVQSAGEVTEELKEDK